MDLFTPANGDSKMYRPLAERMRPRTLEEFAGQNAVTNQLRRAVETDRIVSMIFYGPPGCGKTTLARILADSSDSRFQKLNAALSGIADIRAVIKDADEQRRFHGRKTILFIDEIHRFNKSQQDVLLPYVEDGRLILIGATTENPFFEVNAALLSRVRLIRLTRLNVDDISEILRAAVSDRERGLDVSINDSAIEIIADVSNGDARMALNILEQASAIDNPISVETLEKIIGGRIQLYDKRGDNHYDLISALIKSMRGSDPDAAIFYLAKLISGGEDLNFIARRIVICAAEDVGNAAPMALVLANAAAQAAQFVGLPEARIILAEAVTYIASAPKSNAAYLAIDRALADVRSKDCGEVPSHLRDAHYKGAKALGHGEGYIYPHDRAEHFVRQQYLPSAMKDARYYEPTELGAEKQLRDRLKHFRPERYF